MTIGFDNLTENATTNTTISDIQGGMSETVGEWIAGSYGLVGMLFIAFFAYTLWKYNVSFDTGAAFMVPMLFVFGRYNLLPGGSGTVYGITVAVFGLLVAGIYRYFR